jgi:hypothetical protein
MALSPNELQSKRKFPRRRFARVMGVLINGDYSVNMGAEIGEGGLAFLSTHQLPLDAEAVISFQIPSGSFVCVRIQIRNQQPDPSGGYLMGCSFENLKFEHKREIRSYVSARSEYE